MAVGDTVGQIATSTFSFQPASGVQVCITQFISTSSANYMRGKGGINTAGNNIQMSSGFSDTNLMRNFLPSQKWFIDNTSYLEFFASNTRVGFLGIQTQ